MLLEFTSEPQAAAAAFQLQELARQHNAAYAENEHMLLRIGAHACDVVVDELDVYGPGVNLAARLASNAGPAEIWVSAETLDGLAPGLDADPEDLGELYFKHIATPTHAYRLGPAGPRRTPLRDAPDEASQLFPTLAVIPFSWREGERGPNTIGDVLADEIIAGLSRAPELRVISRLSTVRMRGRALPSEDVSAALSARFIVQGAMLAIDADGMRVDMQLVDARSSHVVWAQDYRVSLRDLLAGQDPAVEAAVLAIGTAIARQALSRAVTAPLPSLDSCSLLLGSIALMHRASKREFDRAHDMLEVLADRHRRLPHAHAWLGKWHVLRAVQGWSDDKGRDTREALSSLRRALDADPSCSLALTIEGLVQAYLLKDAGAAEHLYAQALQNNPSESLAWLFTSTLHSYKGEGAMAAQAAERALSLSPLDPLRYFFDSLAATAVLSSDNYARAIELAQRSLRLNRSHTSTYRTLAIAQMLSGQADAARHTVSALRQLEPQLTVRGFIDRYPGKVAAQIDTYAEALRASGLPD